MWEEEWREVMWELEAVDERVGLSGWLVESNDAKCWWTTNGYRGIEAATSTAIEP